MTKGKPVVLVGCPLPPCFEEAIGAAVSLQATGAISPAAIPNCPEAWGIVVRSESTIRRAVLDAYPSLRLIVRAGTGMDNIDVEEARRRGIEVVNIAGRSSRDVAELAMAFVLCLARRLPEIARDGQGRLTKESLVGTRVCGKRLGVIGCGRIGTEVARIGGQLGLSVSTVRLRFLRSVVSA